MNQNMDMVMVKNEENHGRRRICMVEGASQATHHVKRRRRDPSAVAPVGDETQSQQLQQQQTDQASATTAVKRSSRFRGVSRSVEEIFIGLYILQITYPSS